MIEAKELDRIVGTVFGLNFDFDLNNKLHEFDVIKSPVSFETNGTDWLISVFGNVVCNSNKEDLIIDYQTGDQETVEDYIARMVRQEFARIKKLKF